MALTAGDIEAQTRVQLATDMESKVREITIQHLAAQIQSDRQRVSEAKAALDLSDASLEQSIAEHDSYNPPVEVSTEEVAQG